MDGIKKRSFLKLPPSSPYHDLPLFVSLLAVVAFFAITFSLPTNSKIFQVLFPKPSSHAAITGTALLNNVVSVPLVITTTQPFDTASFTVAVSGGTLQGMTCGVGTFTGTKSSATNCAVDDGQLATNAGPRIVGYAVVKGTGAVGSMLRVTASSVVIKNIDGTALTGSFETGEYTIANALPVNKPVSLPLILTASGKVTASEFSPTITGVQVQSRSIICRGDGFIDSGGSSSSRCVVFYPVSDADRQNGNVGVAGGVLGTITFTPTTTGQLTLTANNVQLSDASGNQVTGSFQTLNITVTSETTPTGTTGATATTAPTNTVQPTNATVSPSPSSGALRIMASSVVPPTFESTVNVTGEKASGTTVTLKLNGAAETVVESNTATTTWTSSSVALQLGNNTLVYSAKTGTTVNNSATLEVLRYGLGDINASGRVDVFDLGIFSGHYGQTGVAHDSRVAATLRLSDMKKDGSIDIYDLGMFAGAYGQQYVYVGLSPTPTIPGAPTPTSGPTATTGPTVTNNPTATARPTTNSTPTPTIGGIGNGIGENTEANLKVAMMGDQGTSPAVFTLAKNEGADLVVHLGDFDYKNSPSTWKGVVDTLGDIPYLAVVGNHDDNDWASGYKPDINARIAHTQQIMPGALTCQDDVGVKGSCVFKGLRIMLMGNGLLGSGHESYIDQVLGADNHVWRICAWHVNMGDMQTGGKGDEAGWGGYQACQRHGALVATGHEHTYERTYTLTNVGNRSAAHGKTGAPATVEVGANKNFVFVNGLAGAGPRDYQCNHKGDTWWASAYATNYHLKNGVVIQNFPNPSNCSGSIQNFAFGVLFVEFNVDNDPRKARAYMKNVKGELIDEFIINSTN